MTIDALRTEQGMITLLEMDRVPVLAEALGLQLSDKTQQAVMDEVMRSLMQTISPHTSGVVLSAEHSLRYRSEIGKKSAAIFSLEKKTPAIDPLIPPRFVEGWGVESIANNYGVAKLELYYHPEEEHAALKKQIVAETYDYCKYEGIAFVLELLVYHKANEKPSPQGLTETQLTAVQEFRDSCDMMALEYLGDSLAAVTITAELDIPWIVTGREQEYQTVKNELRAALESGAEGFLLGDVFWPKVAHAEEDSGGVSVALLVAEVEKQARDHVIELTRIVREHASMANE